MRNHTRRESIELELSQSVELDLDTFEHLAGAAGAIAEAEATFLRLADWGWSHG